MPNLHTLLVNQPRVLAVFLFGSLAEGYATPQSDIDLGVLFDRDVDLKREIAFSAQVGAALGTDKVDVVNLNRASLLLRFRAIAGKLLYE
ncbi:MAG: nucleotidyltransferase domain-containing protein, partial [Chloroflexi bacterium]|nr:nucleotidyltransferase domain-containing protein [Chloroflexota bacterium]